MHFLAFLKIIKNLKLKTMSWDSGFIRNKKGWELNWSIYEWALPFSVDFTSEYLVFVRFLFISVIFPKNEK